MMPPSCRSNKQIQNKQREEGLRARESKTNEFEYRDIMAA
jgi:hypothetical protein